MYQNYILACIRVYEKTIRFYNILHCLSMKLNVHFQGGGKELMIKVTEKTNYLLLFDSYDMEHLQLQSGILSSMAWKFYKFSICYHKIAHISTSKAIFSYSLKYTQGVLCLRRVLRLWKNNRVSRKPCKPRSDLVLNGQIRVPK